jgi:hypothetical protein
MMKSILAMALCGAVFTTTSCNKCVSCKKNNLDKVEFCKGDTYYDYATMGSSAFTDSVGNTYTGCK